jgi:hypothetical protein
MMVGVKTQKDPRDGLHHGGWMMKVICWCLMIIFTFFLPNEIISFYGESFLLCNFSLHIEFNSFSLTAMHVELSFVNKIIKFD